MACGGCGQRSGGTGFGGGGILGWTAVRLLGGPGRDRASERASARGPGGNVR